MLGHARACLGMLGMFGRVWACLGMRGHGLAFLATYRHVLYQKASKRPFFTISPNDPKRSKMTFSGKSVHCNVVPIDLN